MKIAPFQCPSVAEDTLGPVLLAPTYAPDLVKYLTIPLILFLLGVSGVFLNKKNILIILMSVELMLLAINFNFIIFSVYLDDIVGEVFALFVLTVAAAESAIGLAILVVYYRVRGTIAIELVSLLRA
jgi:NADH-quinone oxidoreductase subunit K